MWTSLILQQRAGRNIQAADCLNRTAHNTATDHGSDHNLYILPSRTTTTSPKRAPIDLTTTVPTPIHPFHLQITFLQHTRLRNIIYPSSSASTLDRKGRPGPRTPNQTPIGIPTQNHHLLLYNINRPPKILRRFSPPIRNPPQHNRTLRRLRQHRRPLPHLQPTMQLHHPECPQNTAGTRTKKCRARGRR